MAKSITPTGGKPNSGKNDVKTAPFEVGKSGAEWFPGGRTTSEGGFIGGGKKVSTGKKK